MHPWVGNNALENAHLGPLVGPTVVALTVEPAAIEDLAAQGVDAQGPSLVLTAVGQVWADGLTRMVEAVDPLAEALGNQELLEGERDGNRLIVEGREGRKRGRVLIGAIGRNKVGDQIRAGGTPARPENGGGAGPPVTVTRAVPVHIWGNSGEVESIDPEMVIGTLLPLVNPRPRWG